MENPSVPNRVESVDFTKHMDYFRRIKAFEAADVPRFETNVESSRMRIAAQQSRSAIASSNSSPKVSSVFERRTPRKYLRPSNGASPFYASSSCAGHGHPGDDAAAPSTISSSSTVYHLALAEALIATADNVGWNAAYQAASAEGSTWLERQRMRQRQMRRWAAVTEASACAVRVGEATLAELKALNDQGAAALDPVSEEDSGFTPLIESFKLQALAAEAQFKEYADADMKQRSAEENEEAAKGTELAATLEAAKSAHAEATAALNMSTVANTPHERAEPSSPKGQTPVVHVEARIRAEETTATLFAAQRACNAHLAKAKRATEIRHPSEATGVTHNLLSTDDIEYCAKVAAESVAPRAFAADRAHEENPSADLDATAEAAEKRRCSAAMDLWSCLALDDDAADEAEIQNSSSRSNGSSFRAVEEFLHPPSPQVSYASLPQVRAITTRVFNNTVGRANQTALSIDTKWPEEGEPGYYEFTTSALGHVLFNERGFVAKGFETHGLELSAFKYHLKGDRSAWGALLTSLFNQWDKNPAEYRVAAAKHMRYVVLDDATRALGFECLLRENWDALGKDSRARKDALKMATRRFNLSRPMQDVIGVDFFVSHNWSDENAPHRWAVLCCLSDLFSERYGRLPRFWLGRFCINQSKLEDITLKTSMLPAILMSCKNVLVLQSPFYLGCSNPPALPSLWCIVEFFTLCCLAPHDDPTRNLVWVPLFNTAGVDSSTGHNVPPKLDLLHGRVYCFSQEDKERLLAQLSACPGGLVEVQRAMSAVWPVHFREAYANWAQLASASGEGDVERCTALLRAGACVDLPFEWSPTSSVGTMVLVAATVLHEHWRWARKKEWLAKGGSGSGGGIDSKAAVDPKKSSLPSGSLNPRWKKVDSTEYDAWFDSKLHAHMVRDPLGCAAKQGSSKVHEVDIDQPFGLLPPSWQHENLLQARSALEVVRDYPEFELDEWAAIVHEQWLDHRRAETISASAAGSAAHALPDWIVEQGLDLPFAQLSMLEQEKDRVVVRVAMLLRTDATLPHVASLSPGSPAHFTSTASFPGHKRGLLASSVDDIDGDVFGDDDVEVVEDENAESASDTLNFVQQPLQAAVSRFLRMQLSHGNRSLNNECADELSGEPPDLLLSSSSDGPDAKPSPEGFDPRESCLSDPVVAMLLDAGADPISAVNQPILGNPALSDAAAFQLLADLLGPLFKAPPHVLSLLHNQLSRRGIRRLLRFQRHVNELYSQRQRGLHLNGYDSGSEWRDTSTSRNSISELVEQVSSPAALRRSDYSSGFFKPMGQSGDVRGKAPLRSLCGLNLEAIRAIWPIPLDNNQESDEDEVEDIILNREIVPSEDAPINSPTTSQYPISPQQISEDTCNDDSKVLGSTVDTSTLNLDAFDEKPALQAPMISAVPGALTKFQAVNQPELRPASFLLLLSELMSSTHVHTLTALDLSSNANLKLSIERFGSFSNLQRLIFTSCPSMVGSLQRLARCCPKLTHLQVCYTSVGGNLEGIGAVLPELRVLDLGHTLIEGEIGGLVNRRSTSKLQWLGLANLRNLNGALLPALNLPMVQYLDLYHTAVSGTLVGAAKCWPSLTYLKLESCKELRGSTLAGCQKLRDLNLTLTYLSSGLAFMKRLPEGRHDETRVSALLCPVLLGDEDGDGSAQDVEDGSVVETKETLLVQSPTEAGREAPSTSVRLSETLEGNPLGANLILKDIHKIARRKSVKFDYA